MADIALPPPEINIYEVVRDWPQCLSVRLYTNPLPEGVPRQLSDYQEPDFPGYQPWNNRRWPVLYSSPEDTLHQIQASARFTLTEPVAPVIIRGYFVTALWADDYFGVVAEYTATTPVIIASRGDTVLALTQLTALRAALEGESFQVWVQGQLLLLTNGGTNVLFRGKERRQLQKLVKVIQSIKTRDARWPNRSPRSRQADLVMFPAGAPDNHNQNLENVLNRAQAMLLME